MLGSLQKQQTNKTRRGSTLPWPPGLWSTVLSPPIFHGHTGAPLCCIRDGNQCPAGLALSLSDLRQCHLLPYPTPATLDLLSSPQWGVSWNSPWAFALAAASSWKALPCTWLVPSLIQFPPKVHLGKAFLAPWYTHIPFVFLWRMCHLRFDYCLSCSLECLLHTSSCLLCSPCIPRAYDSDWHTVGGLLIAKQRHFLMREFPLAFLLHLPGKTMASSLIFPIPQVRFYLCLDDSPLAFPGFKTQLYCPCPWNCPQQPGMNELLTPPPPKVLGHTHLCHHINNTVLWQAVCVCVCVSRSLVWAH